MQLSHSNTMANPNPKHKFAKGNKGKPVGTVNETTKLMRSVKEVVLNAFNELQQDPKANILTWGKENPKDFYTIAAKLIPTELNAKVEGDIKMRDLIITPASKEIKEEKADDSK